MAKKWLQAVKAKDKTQLATLTHLPFTDDGLHSHKCKAKKVSASAADLDQLLSCLAKDDLLLEAIPEDPKYLDDFKVRPLKDITHKAFTKKLTRLSADHAIVTGGLSGDGISFELAFAIRPDGTIDTVLGYAEAVE